MSLLSSASRTGKALAFLACFIVSRPANAQSNARWTPTVAVGSRVRVAVDSPAVSRLTGEYRGFARDAIHLTLRDHGAMAIPVRRVIYLDASGGRDRLRYSLKWGLYGAAAGALAGALIGESEDPGGAEGLAGFLGGAIAGLPIGAIAGAIWAPERWIRHFNFSRGTSASP